jgi:hypothetical protein
MSAPAITSQPSRTRHASFNCRVYERQSCKVPTACQPAASYGLEENHWSGTIRDVSLGGLRLILERRFEPGIVLAVELPENPPGETKTILLKVVHVKRQLDGYWSLGCQFVSEMSEDELQRLLPTSGQGSGEGEALAADAAESALTSYFGPLTVAKVRLQIELTSVTLAECIADQMIVPATWPLAPGKTVSVRGGKKSGSPWQVQLRVTRCAKQPEGWILRGQLLNGPSATDLLQAIGRGV